MVKRFINFGLYFSIFTVLPLLYLLWQDFSLAKHFGPDPTTGVIVNYVWFFMLSMLITALLWYLVDISRSVSNSFRYIASFVGLLILLLLKSLLVFGFTLSYYEIETSYFHLILHSLEYATTVLIAFFYPKEG